MSTDKIFMTCCLLLFPVLSSACAPQLPVAIPRLSKKPVIEAADANSKAVSTLRCQSSNGTRLERCIEGLAVTCEQRPNGEYCVQYSDKDHGRMWGPF